MNISIRLRDPELTNKDRDRLEEKFGGIARLLGSEGDQASLDIDVEPAPAEGRSATPHRLVANLTFNDTVLHAEAVKPTPESAADRVRSELDHEIRRTRGRSKRLARRGWAMLKDQLRFG